MAFGKFGVWMSCAKQIISRCLVWYATGACGSIHDSSRGSGPLRGGLVDFSTMWTDLMGLGQLNHGLWEIGCFEMHVHSAITYHMFVVWTWILLQKRLWNLGHMQRRYAFRGEYLHAACSACVCVRGCVSHVLDNLLSIRFHWALCSTCEWILLKLTKRTQKYKPNVMFWGTCPMVIAQS